MAMPCPILAGAVQLVGCDAAPAGNHLPCRQVAFSINAQGQMSVTYTVNGTSSVVPFSIGIFGST